MSLNNPFKGKFGPTKIDIPAGETRDIGFGVQWQDGKREVKLFFGESEDDTIVLDEEKLKKGNLVITIKGENTDPMYIELIPDFDKKEIITKEIETGEKGKGKGAKLSFGGMVKE